MQTIKNKQKVFCLALGSIIGGIFVLLLGSGLFYFFYLKPKCCLNDLNLQTLKNLEYQTTFQKQKVRLVDGIYYFTPPPGEPAEDYYLQLEKNHIAYGDLNNDHKKDAAVILKSRRGGTGVFRDLAVVINQPDQPDNRAVKFLGDRTKIYSLRIQRGAIILVLEEWRGGPTGKQTVKYRLVDSQLQAVE